MTAKRLLFCFAIFSVAAVSLRAEDPATGITPGFMEQLWQTTELSPVDTAFLNALTNNQVTNLVLNRDLLMKHNDFFNHKIETKGITDQKSSGRCWLFAGLNVLRPRVIKKYNLSEFEFSQSYLFFWDKMEKANFFLEYVIHNIGRDPLDREYSEILDNGIGDGGYWSYVVDLVTKYGVVPKSAMPETYNSSTSWSMGGAISEAVRTGAMTLRAMAKDGADETALRDKKLEILKSIYKILVLNLGEPPREFVWRYEDKDGKVSEGKAYTPLSFYQAVVGVNLRDYVSLMNYPGKEYYKLYQMDNTRNMYDVPDQVSANLPMEEIKKLMQASILANEPIWFASDIGKEAYGDKGILSARIFDYSKIYGPGPKMDKADWILLRHSTSNHAMIITGVDVQDGKSVKWLVENSHGKDSGHDGYYTMYNDWFDDYAYEAIVNIKYLPPEIRDIFKQAPIHLPLWDPMTKLLRVD